VVLRCYQQPVTIQSNYARENAAWVAMAASIGLITTKVFFVDSAEFSRAWRVTAKGLQSLEGMHQ